MATEGDMKKEFAIKSTWNVKNNDKISASEDHTSVKGLNDVKPPVMS